MLKLNNCGVIFDEELHSYRLNDKKLSGITDAIKKYFFADMYSEVPEAILTKAATKGSEIHKEIEQIISGFAPEVMTAEAEFFADKIEEGEINPIATEYTVTDSENFASNIDIVEKVKDAENLVDIGDIKTTYNLNKDYCRWQLSVYAYLFELVNPEIKVRNLRVFWLKKGKYDFLTLQRIDGKTIKEFLEAAAKGMPFKSPIETEKKEFGEEVGEMVNRIFELEKSKKSIEEEQQGLKSVLFEMMKTRNQKKVQNDLGSITFKDATKTLRFDSAKFKADQPDVYAEYMKESEIKGSLLVKVI